MVFNREGRLHLCSQATRKTFSKLWSPLSSTMTVLWFGCSGMYLLRFSPQHALKVWNGNKKCWMWLYWGTFLRRIYCEKDSPFLAIKPVYFSWSQPFICHRHSGHLQGRDIWCWATSYYTVTVWSAHDTYTKLKRNQGGPSDLILFIKMTGCLPEDIQPHSQASLINITLTRKDFEDLDLRKQYIYT